ncbi:MAG: DUF4386 family protein [Anaerolineaceae bacterium]|nr:DUF4386 family protein [Anaerolineaceae bacterium]
MEKNNWSFLYKTAGIIAWITLGLIPIQIVIFILWPPPTTVLDFYSLFQKNALIGLFDLDLLYLLTVLFMGYLYLAFFAALINTHKSIATIALALGLIGVAVYFVSNVSFEMMSLSNQYLLAETNELKTILLTTGKVMLTRYHGTAFGVYYILNGLSLVLFSVAMIRNEVFSKKTAYIGLVAGILMLVPSTIGMVGMIFALTSLIPTSIWLFMIARRLNQIENEN